MTAKCNISRLQGEKGTSRGPPKILRYLMHKALFSNFINASDKKIQYAVQVPITKPEHNYGSIRCISYALCNIIDFGLAIAALSFKRT